MSRSLLPIVATADNFPYLPHTIRWKDARSPPTAEVYIPFYLTAEDQTNDVPPVGLIRPEVMKCMEQLFGNDTKPFRLLSAGTDSGNDGICFNDWVVKQRKMGEVMHDIAVKWRDEGKFPGPLGGWRNEHYTIFADRRSAIFSTQSADGPLSNAAFTIERAACALFGLRTIGVHMTAYEGEGKDMKIWVPRRSATKATWPSKLDNSVAGGIPAGMKPIDSMIKECDEEASLPEVFVRKYMKQTGAVTYFYVTEDGWLQPELEYTYDLQLPPQDSPEYIRPKPHDDEVESFALLPLADVVEALHNGEFKPNCGLILVDFLIRHNLVTPEEEPNYFEIIQRSHRDLDSSVTYAAGSIRPL